MLTLLDIAKRTGSDALIGLIEEVIKICPEFRVLPVVERDGIAFLATLRTSLPTAAFVDAGTGVALSKSAYAQKLVQCFFLDCQLRVPEAIVQADDRSVGDVLADEAMGGLEAVINHLGTQTYYGTAADAKGFSGFVANVDSTMVVNATGEGSATTSVWMVWADPKGVHLPLGRGGKITMPEWQEQQVTDAEGKAQRAFCTNIAAWIGLSIGSKFSIGRIKNVTSAKPVTDALGSQLYAKFPIGRKPNLCFMNRDALYFLQASRSAVGAQKSNASGDAFAPIPEFLAGVPIIPTDAITSAEIAA
jgi:hypothetical protein